ncbi:MAG: CHAT domain-containing protein [Planctomycetia bacterium]|nr:CHAT domain-containing protein [Planctomycetia bacterium]
MRAMTLAEVADAVLAAIAAKDEATLRALARRDRPDPWIVADELVARGRPDEARAFASAAPRTDVEALPAYLASRSGTAADDATRALLARAEASIVAKRPADALAETAGVDAAARHDVLGVRLLFARALAARMVGRPDEVAEAFLATADAAERLGWIARASVALFEAGNARNRGARYDDAIRLWTRERAIHERRGERRLAASAEGNIAMAWASLGDSATAVAGYERALRTLVEVGDRRSAAMVLGNLAAQRFLRGELVEARAAHQEALAVFGALGDRAAAGRTQQNLGLVFAALGDLDQAAAAYGAALALHAADDRVERARTLSSLADLHRQRGDLGRALSVAEEALAAVEGAGMPDAEAAARAALATMLFHVGDYDRSVRLHRQALEAYEASGARAGIAAQTVELGNIHLARHELDEAAEYLERALEAWEALGQRRNIALVLANLGLVARERGDPARALSLYERAGRLQAEAGERRGAALTLGNVGSVRRDLGESSKAAEAFQRAIDELEALRDPVSTAEVLAKLASLRLAERDPSAALDLSRRAVARLALAGRDLAPTEGLAARERVALAYDTGTAAAVALGDVEALASFLEQGRARSWLDALRARTALEAVVVPDELRRAESTARAKLTAALDGLRRASAGDDRARLRAAVDEVDRAHEGVAAAVARIQREAKAGAAVLHPDVATVDAVRGTLSPGDALVLYGLSPSSACALVVEPRGARIVSLPAARTVEAAVAALAFDAPEVDPSPAIAHLAELVVKPLGLTPAVRRVLVSPSGALSYVPFAALIPDRAVAYAPSGTVHRWLRDQGALRGDGVLALGDPDYATRVDERALEVHRGAAARLAPLPGTRREVEAFGDLKLLAADATEARLRAALATRPRWRAVHLACHGLVDAERPMRSSLAITPSGDDDGFLTCLDVFRLEAPADLVVLSACETGRGKVVLGEGIVGLTRAFMYAGSPRVVCSLWKVDDAATSALMTKFYELWNPKDGSKGLPTAEALREAQAFVRAREQWKHPYYWAAWVLWGLPD